MDLVRDVWDKSYLRLLYLLFSKIHNHSLGPSTALHLKCECWCDSTTVTHRGMRDMGAARDMARCATSGTRFEHAKPPRLL